MIRNTCWAYSLILIACCAYPLTAQNSFTFSVPDGGLPSAAGDGLRGTIWSADDIGPVDLLADARSYIGSNPSSATFVASAVDYPQGATGSIATETLIKDVLGTDAPSLSPTSVGDRAALNSILRFNGFLRVDSAGPLSFGLASDDGSELLIQGTRVIDNDGLHSYPGNSGPVDVQFDAPGLYAIEILFFESQQTDWGIEFFRGSTGPISTDNLYQAVPEPGACALGVLAILGMMAMRRRQ